MSTMLSGYLLLRCHVMLNLIPSQGAGHGEPGRAAPRHSPAQTGGPGAGAGEEAAEEAEGGTPRHARPGQAHPNQAGAEEPPTRH